MSLEARNITKTFNGFNALKGVSLSVERGEFMALLGPSGSGKTTLLRIMAGLDTQDGGEIRFDEADVSGVALRDRKVGFVFQHYALFRHMTVSENVAFGLKVRPAQSRPNVTEIKRRVDELLHLVQLEHMGQRFPSQLSGGQRQRVALARALAIEPSVLLLDEPFGALDAKVRKDLRRWLRKLHNDFHITSIFVTHDQEEALDVADRIVVMNNGKIEQIGSPEEVYDHPNSPFVYDFLGNVNLFKGRIHKGRLKQGSFEMDVPEFSGRNEEAAVGYVRPHDIHLEKVKTSADAVSATVSHIHVIGPIVQIELKRE